MDNTNYKKEAKGVGNQLEAKVGTRRSKHKYFKNVYISKSIYFTYLLTFTKTKERNE